MSDLEDAKGDSLPVEANKQPSVVANRLEQVSTLEQQSIHADKVASDEEGTASLASLKLSAEAQDANVEKQMTRMSRQSFLRGSVAAAAGLLGWHWLNQQRAMGKIAWPFRVSFEVNENLARDYYSPSRLAPTFVRSLAVTPKENGQYGLETDLDAAAWKLSVIGLSDTSQSAARRVGLIEASTASAPTAENKKGSKSKTLPVTPDSTSGDQGTSDPSNADDTESASPSDTASEGLTLTLKDIQKLPRFEMVTELKCIEGWSVVVEWAGARFADFVAHYRQSADKTALPAYVAIETPDGAYYVGLDLESALHPQTLLCYEMNGKPLTSEHGAPLRLVIPVKYGIKNIKRIGTIRFTEERPKDYWAEQGYDWYSGH